MSSATVPAGGALFFSAEGFQPGEVVTATLVPQSAVVLSRATRGGDGCPDGAKCGTTFRANEQGTVIGCFIVPEDTPPGRYLFTLTGEESGSVSAPVTVTPGDGNGGGNHHRPARAATEASGGDLTRATKLALKSGFEGQPGAVTVTGNGKTLSLKPGTADGRAVPAATGRSADLALAAYDGGGRDATGTGPSETGSGMNWALTGGAAALAAIAVRTVTVVRRRRTRTEQG
ncbi:hypothetical protein [Streptomyces bullii]|uniref:Neocarzinostatin family protein n=1 Tax=Streptomyces bullii TaxID=349910 RepID=A0ABW0ULN3_9ACTN